MNVSVMGTLMALGTQPEKVKVFQLKIESLKHSKYWNYCQCQGIVLISILKQI